jgi:hypothetical protein
MRLWLVFPLLVLGGASAQAQLSCNTTSRFKGSTEPSVRAVLASLKGTVAMGGKGGCSGALVTFHGRSASQPALVLSAGHCSEHGRAEVPIGKRSLTMPDNGEVLYHVSSRRPLTLETGNSDQPRTCIAAEEIVYATMTGVDVMLLQASETYEQIQKRTGVSPFLVSQETSFAPGFAVRIPSARWQNDRACQVDATVDKLAEFRWLWGPVLRIRPADSCATPHGVSGAPVIHADSNEVIGLFGTASDGNGAACELNNPCEVAPDGSKKAAVREQPYVHFVHAFYTCLDASRSVDLDVPGCLLPKPRP